jgi:hypothetical protein
MNNADMPAAPVQDARRYYPGLTKREAFAMAAMQGNLASPETAGAGAQEIAQWSVYQADALLFELAKVQP